MGIKFKVDEGFFETWSSDMAYILGYWYADGSVEYSPSMRGHYIRISSVDKDIISAIRGTLKSEHTIIIRKEAGVRDRYLLRIGSKRLFYQLLERGVVERKSLIITFPEVPIQFLHSFIRGYFDGDGCVHVEKDALGNPKRLTTVFTSGSKDFLEKLNEILHTNVGVQSHKKIIITKGGYGSAHQLRFSSKESLLLFSYLYPKNQKSHLCLQRKYDIFMRYLNAKKLIK